MEAAKMLGLYTAKCTITLSCEGLDAQEVCDKGSWIVAWLHLHDKYGSPWNDTSGNSLHDTLEISGPALRRRVRGGSDASEVVIRLWHKGLALTTKQVFAYEQWLNGMAECAVNALSRREAPYNRSRTKGKSTQEVTWDARLVLTTTTPDRPVKNYNVEAEIGDVVRMKDGTIAVIADQHFDCGGNCRILTLRPICGFWRYLWMHLGRRLKPADEQINALTKVGEVPL